MEDVRCEFAWHFATSPPECKVWKGVRPLSAGQTTAFSLSQQQRLPLWAARQPPLTFTSEAPALNDALQTVESTKLLETLTKINLSRRLAIRTRSVCQREISEVMLF